MADKPLKSITFPDLPDRYTIPQIDTALETAGMAADAKATGDELTDLKSAISYHEDKINYEHDLVDYGYNRTKTVVSKTSSYKVAVEQIGTRVKLNYNGDDSYGNRIKISGGIDRYRGSTYKNAVGTVSLEPGETYQVVNRHVSGTGMYDGASYIPAVIVYENQGSDGIQTSVYTDDTVKISEFTATSASVNLMLFIQQTAVLTDYVADITLIKKTEEIKKVVDDAFNLLRSGIISKEGKTSASLGFEQGAISSSGGGNSSSDTRIRTTNYTKIENRVRFSCADGYEFAVFVYDGTAMQYYLGVYDGANIQTTVTWTNSIWLGSLDKNYYFRIVIRKQDDSSITTSDNYAFDIYVGTSVGFNAPGIPADSKAVGDALETKMSLTMGSASLLTSGTDLDELVAPGCYYTRSAAESASVVNSPTSSVSYRLYVMESVSTDRFIQIAFANYAVDSDWLTGIIVRRKTAAAGEWSPWIPLASRTELGDISSRTIRVMQYNIGKFRWGYVDGLETYGLTEAQYKEKLLNYKNFFAKYHPDVLGLQECTLYMDKAQTHQTKPALFNDIFNYVSSDNYYNTTLVECEICARGSVSEGQRYMVQDTNGSVKTWFKLATLKIGNKTVRLATGALSSSGTSAQRAEQLEYLITNKLASYDYAIIMSDLNSGYAVDAQTGELVDNNALSVILSTADSYGFSPCQGMGEYWGATETYVRHEGLTPDNIFRCLDNILVKGNIKIRNFEVLTDEYDDLASDHIPVIADLYIY